MTRRPASTILTAHRAAAHDAPDPTRRRLLQAGTLTLAALALPIVPRAWAAGAAPRIDRTRFPQSLACGDPRPDRVLLWTRVVGSAPKLRLQAAEDEGFAQVVLDRAVAVPADTDGCVRVRVTGLQPGTRYFYRFVIDAGTGAVASPTGRTRTAPAADAAAPLRLAFLSCQDYGGRWYNTLLPLLDLELDGIVHLGDFIYETAGDPGFQSASDERSIHFDDLAGALPLGTRGKRYYAARSLDNYRQLHRSFRSDEVLQRLLERAPLIAVWDDHEFSNDCWADHGTYDDGRSIEADSQRRRNAERAYFEYMPVDLDPEGDERVPEQAALYPNTRLWRTLRFGRDVELWLTDYRSFRPDHLIPEDAFPGALALDRPALEALGDALGKPYAALAPQLLPYLDPSQPEHAALRAPLRQAIAAAYVEQGLTAEAAQHRAEALVGAPLAYAAVAGLLQGWNTTAPEARAVPVPTPPTDADRGLPWLALGKTKLFDSTGARYFVVAPSYELLAAARAAQGLPSALGEAQSAWLARTMRGSDATWKLVASSVSFTSIKLDLARPQLQAPEAMRHVFYLNVDHWDGFPVERARLLGEVFDAAGGAIVLSGDIHAGFATQHTPRTVEFTAPAVSSQTIGSILASAMTRDPATAETGRRLVADLDAIIRAGLPGLRYAQTRRHGVGVLELDGGQARMRFIEAPESACRERMYDRPQAYRALTAERRFRIDADDRTLRVDDGDV